MKIRRAVLRDVHSVRVLLADTFVPTYAPLIGREATDALHRHWHSEAALRGQVDRADGAFLIAEDAAGLVAHAYAAEVPPSVLTVFRLYVARSHRRRGIGSALLDALYAQVPGAALVRLDVVAGDAPALSFYESRGFRVAGETEAEGVASLRMERTLPR